MEHDKFVLYKGVWIGRDSPHLSCYLSKQDCSALLNGGGYLLRNIYDWDSSEKTDFWFIIKDHFGGLEELPTKVRNQVRKSLRIYDIKRVSQDEFLQIVYPIYRSAMNAYRVKSKLLDEETFRLDIKTKCAIRNIDLWCVFEKETGKPVAFSVNSRYEDYCEYNTMKADPLYLRNSTYPYYGLLFEMNKYYLEQLGLKYVSDGARSITEHSNIQPFLEEKFCFRKAYCRLQIEYQWWMKVLVSLLYPFRSLIPVLTVKSILRMEEMRRNSLK